MCNLDITNQHYAICSDFDFFFWIKLHRATLFTATFAHYFFLYIFFLLDCGGGHI